MTITRRLLLCITLLLGACASSSGGDDHARTDLSIVSFNLYHDKAEWPLRRAWVIEQLRQLDPDVIVLQEVLQHASLRNQAEDLAQALGYQAWFSSVDPAASVHRYGNAILTRDPVLARDWAPLRPLQDSRNVAHVRINLHGQPLNIYAVHPNYRSDAEGAAMRRQQFADALDFVAHTASEAPSIIAGDFNASSDSPEMSVFDAHYVNAYEQAHPEADAAPAAHTTLNPHYFKTDTRRIDHVYLQRDSFQVSQARIVLNQADAAGTWPSDHFGVYVRASLLSAH